MPAALLLTLGGETASPLGRIVIDGPDSGTHLRLEASGRSLTVFGPVAGEPAGCHFAQGRRTAVCPLGGVGSIEVDMGPADDKVEVLTPLPVPLTAYLGSGSDKLIGSAEADTCYPQGSVRNRCIGGGGNDVCISAPVNTDCVGGPGDDYCRTGEGSDGCWGGPGRDVCYMGEGHDGCHGEGGDDRLFGGPSSDQLYGGGGFDHCDGDPGVGRSRECETGPGR
jgi:RTX calcium-binding nonapeptide repeat (4 copies)